VPRDRPLKRIAAHFVAAAIASYLLFALLGLAAPPYLGDRIPDMEARSALSFSFAEEGNEWAEAAGYVSHGWLYRRAYLRGTPTAGSGFPRSEQALKSGWPFTVVRGFVRTRGEEVALAGAGWASTPEPGQPARLLPLQPIWPGILLYGLVGALLSLAGTIRRRFE